VSLSGIACFTMVTASCRCFSNFASSGTRGVAGSLNGRGKQPYYLIGMSSFLSDIKDPSPCCGALLFLCKESLFVCDLLLCCKIVLMWG